MRESRLLGRRPLLYGQMRHSQDRLMQSASPKGKRLSPVPLRPRSLNPLALRKLPTNGIIDQLKNAVGDPSTIPTSSTGFPRDRSRALGNVVGKRERLGLFYGACSLAKHSPFMTDQRHFSIKQLVFRSRKPSLFIPLGGHYLRRHPRAGCVKGCGGARALS